MTEFEEEEPAPWESPPPADPEDSPAGQLVFAASDERIFGAVPVNGRYNPVPIFAVAGVDVASGPGVGGAPAGVIVLDDLRIYWGRSDVLSQADPATGAVSLFDPTRAWAKSEEREGQAVTLRWSGGGLPVGSGTGSTVFFRGRIASCRPAPAVHVYPDGTEVRGELVTMTLTSILTDLANKEPTVAWPEETLGARRVRVAAEAAGTLTSVISRAFWDTPNVAPVAAADQVSVWDHLLSLYDSGGADRMTYWPPDNLTVHLPRRYVPSRRGVAGLWWDGGASNGLPRSGKGVYARSHALTQPETVFSPQPLYLDGRVLEFEEDEGLERGSSARITRVVSTNKDSGASFAARTVVTPTGVDESVAGIRAARLETIVGWNNWADIAASDLASFARKEGAAWHLAGTVRWRTALSGGFEEAVAANVLLYGGEIQSQFFLQSTWLPAYGIRPVFGLIGQTIGYRDGGWELELEFSPVVTDAPQHAITWDEIDDGSTAYEVQWWDGDNQRGLHDSLTYEDLGHVSTGLNVTTIPPDRGWDGR